MKKIYSLIFVLSIIYFKAAAQVWTIYNSSNSALSSGSYNAVDIDQTGNIWAGGFYTGLYKFNGSVWTGWDSFNSNILHDDINDIVVDNNNKIWAGNYKGVSVFNGTTFTNYDTLNAGFNGMTVYALGKDKNGKIWLSSKNGSFYYQGITTFDGTTWYNLTGYPSQALGREFTEFAFTTANDAWIATEAGMLKYSATTFSYWPYANTGLWSSTSIAIDGSGVVWAGGFDGLLKYNGSWTFFGSTTSFGFPSNTGYYKIIVDGNYLWIATSQGLMKFDKNTNTKVALYNHKNSPLDSAGGVYDMARESNGTLWLASNKGMIKLRPSLLAVEENSLEQHISVSQFSPGVFTVIKSEWNTPVKYSFLDMQGKELLKGSLAGSQTVIDATAFAQGMYLLRLRDDKNTMPYCKKLISEK